MHMNRFLNFLMLIAIAGCGGDAAHQSDWFSEYGTLETGTPVQMQYGSPDMQPGTYTDNLIGAPIHKMAVLLPLSGPSEKTGNAVRTAVEIAVLQNAPQNLSVSFYDTASDPGVINTALMENPEIIIGPIFSSDARALRNVKPDALPALSFTSDATAVGNGVMSMALMPINSIEAIIQEMARDNVGDFLILAPDTESGHLMAGAASAASEIYNMGVSGIFYYTPGDTESIKTTSMTASMNTARTAANNRARAVLSDIMTNERLNVLEKSSLTIQLDRLSKSETLGRVPYNAVLFLGDGNDTESLASFLRYYGVATRDARFYGTALWDGSDITNDITMAGAKYATMPEMLPSFSALYERMTDAPANRMAGFGYDATNMAIGMIYSQKSNAAYLLNPSGYIGANGLIRLEPTGENERGLRIVQLNGTGTLQTVRNAPVNFITPIYNLEQRKIEPADAMELETPGIDPDDYITIPARFQEKYASETYGAHMTRPTRPAQTETITITPSDTDDVIVSPDFQPITLESVDRTYIDSVEIEE